MFKECGRQTDRRTRDGRQTDDGRRRPTYPISSPMSLRLRWAKNIDSYIMEGLLHWYWWILSLCGIHESTDACNLASFDVPTRDNIRHYQGNSPIIRVPAGLMTILLTGYCLPRSTSHQGAPSSRVTAHDISVCSALLKPSTAWSGVAVSNMELWDELRSRARLIVSVQMTKQITIHYRVFCRLG